VAGTDATGSGCGAAGDISDGVGEAIASGADAGAAPLAGWGVTGVMTGASTRTGAALAITGVGCAGVATGADPGLSMRGGAMSLRGVATRGVGEVIVSTA
jgi:hypothetical protein